MPTRTLVKRFAEWWARTTCPPYRYLLRAVVRDVRRRWPFVIDGWVVLPDHLHCIWTLPPGDSDFTNRWRLVKAGFARRLPKTEWRSLVQAARGERGIWQRRFWEHAIRDERDYASHMDYLHFNPVKHGYARRVADWPYSSFGRCVEKGLYPIDWGGADVDVDVDVGAVVGERG